jgi:putative FmdB family regulatory protein
MPIYEFECEKCGNRFEELVGSDAPDPACPACGAAEARRLISPVSPPSRQPRGSKVRADEGRRRDRESARRSRLAEAKRKRAAGEL